MRPGGRDSFLERARSSFLFSEFQCIRFLVSMSPVHKTSRALGPFALYRSHTQWVYGFVNICCFVPQKFLLSERNFQKERASISDLDYVRCIIILYRQTWRSLVASYEFSTFSLCDCIESRLCCPQGPHTLDTNIVPSAWVGLQRNMLISQTTAMRIT